MYDEVHRPVFIIGGLHGDEPAGSYAADYFEDRNNVYVFSEINKTGKRKFFHKDLNRHFDKDPTFINEYIIDQIEKLRPRLVISLHEAHRAKKVYAYCSEDMKAELIGIFEKFNLPVVTMSHGDITEKGVITHGRLPHRGSLERAMARRDIPYCTIETPMDWELSERINTMKRIVEELIQ